MAENLIKAFLGGNSGRKWEKKKSLQSYAEFQKLKFSHTGKLQTPTMLIEVTQSGKIRFSSSTGCVILDTTKENILEHMAEILDFGRSLPIMQQVQRTTVEIRTKTLPDYGIREKTPEEKYAERLRQDRWDVRKYGDPSNWRLVRI